MLMRSETDQIDSVLISRLKLTGADRLSRHAISNWTTRLLQGRFLGLISRTSQVFTCRKTWTLETTATRRAHARFSLRSNRSEQTMTFIADTSSKEERRRRGLKGAVPEVQSP